jgi:DNA-binding SARP family transcriptional activator
MLFLSSFGGIAVARPDGTQPGGAASQRKVLALLALSAGAGPQGVSRDRAMALLWPEADADRARHALSQTLYHTRSALGEPELFLSGNEVRLNPAVITPDSWEFERLIAAGDDEAAVALYRGEFLDGFNLPRAGEFEEWASAQRRHFAGLAWAAIERLGARAEAAQDWAAAVVWGQRLAALDITSSRASLRLMEALFKAGDPAAALRHADVHRRAVRAQFETDPDRSIAELEAHIRSAQRSTPGHAAAAVADPDGGAGREGSPTDHATAPVVVAEAWSVAGRVRRTMEARLPALIRRHWRRAGAVAGLAAAGWIVTTFLLREPPAASGQIVIAPFRVSGADRELAHLHEGMVDLLASRLHGDSVGGALDAAHAVAAWRELERADFETGDERALRLARSVGASNVIVGSVVGDERRLHLSAWLLAAPSGHHQHEASAEGPVDSLDAMVDQLAVQFLAAAHGEVDRLSARTKPSLSALREYLAGQKAYRRAQYQRAVRHYELALRADSQFALAAFQLAVASDRVNGGEQNPRALSIAWNRRDELSPRDRAQLVALAGPNYPQPSSASETVFALGSVINLRPLRSDLWYEFGEWMLRQGSALAIVDAPRRAVNAFARALELDPADRAGARPMIVVAAARMNDTAAVRRYASPAAIQDSMRALAPFVQWTAARVLGDDTTLAAVRSRLPEMDPENLRLIAMSSLHDGVLPADGQEAARLLGRRTSGTRGLDALLAQHAFALVSGQTTRALEITGRIGERVPGTNAHLRLRVLDGLYGRGDSTAARQAADQLERSTANSPRETELQRAVYYADLCVLEQWRLRHGASAATPATIAALKASSPPRISIAINTSAHACASILQTWLAVERRHPDARAQVHALDSLLLGGPAVGDAGRYAHILLARLHLRFNDSLAALSALRRRSYLKGWPRYVRTTRATELSLRGAAGSSRSVRGDH